MADQLKAGQQVVPELFEFVTIYFSDIVGFNLLSSQCAAVEIVDLLNDVYSLFDGVIESYDVYKVSETVFVIQVHFGLL